VGVWLGQTTTAHTAPVTPAKTPVWQQVGYAGQLGQTVTGQFPVTFRLYNAGDALAYEETIDTNIQQGRFQVYVGGARGDLRGVLKDAQQMKVFFQGNLVDSLSVLHASQADVQSNMKQFSGLHAVILTDDATAPAPGPQPFATACFILNSGFFTIPFTNTTVGTGTPSCGANNSVSGGYSFLTTPSQGVFVFGLFPVVNTNWQVNYQVGATPATVQTSSFCCP
jgi:hypothetical protein